MSSKIIGVIGLGSIGMRHAKNLLTMGHEVWGFDQSDAALQAMDERIIVHSPEKILTEADGVVFATPPNTRQKIFRNLSPDIPALVEKPIGAFPKDRDLIYEQFNGRLSTARIMMGNNLRFHPCVRWAKDNLHLIGKPLWASFTVAQKNTKYAEPVALNWGAHEVDLALYLLGPAIVSAAAGNERIFDMLLFHTDGAGVPTTIHCDYVTDPERRYFTIVGSDATMEVGLPDINRGASIISNNPKNFPNFFFTDNSTFDENYVEEMQAFIDMIDGKPVPRAATGADGLRALEVILEAMRMGGIK